MYVYIDLEILVGGHCDCAAIIVKRCPASQEFSPADVTFDKDACHMKMAKWLFSVGVHDTPRICETS